MISCIIPVCRPDASFEKLIKMLLKQKERVEEIVLINTRCDDYTVRDLKSVVEKATKAVKDLNHHVDIVIKSVERNEFDHGGTRQFAASLVHGDYMLVMTQDAVPNNTLMTYELKSVFENENVAVAYARQLPNASCGEKERYARSFNYPEKSVVKSAEDLDTMGIKAFFCSDVCAMYRKSIFDDLGGFTTKTIFNEDMIYARKAVDAGYSIAYVAEAEVLHSHNYSYMEQLHRSFDLAVSQKQYSEVFSDVKSESEGMKYVMGGVSKFVKEGKYIDAADLVYDSGFRYVGFLLGKNYDKLPEGVVKKLTSNKGYWSK